MRASKKCVDEQGSRVGMSRVPRWEQQIAHRSSQKAHRSSQKAHKMHRSSQHAHKAARMYTEAA